MPGAMAAGAAATIGVVVIISTGVLPASAIDTCRHERCERKSLLLQLNSHAKMITLVDSGSCNFTRPAKCEAMALHSCTDVEDVGNQGFCPSSCSYALMDPYMPCEAACVTADRCSLGGPIWTYPDPGLRQCTRSPIRGCRRFTAATIDSKPVCEYCGQLGRLAKDGTCEFSGSLTWVCGLVLVVLVLAALWVVAVSVYRASQRPGCPEVLQLGWTHYKRCLVSATSYTDPSQYYVPYRLTTNMHRKLVAGTGCCLYYNTLPAMIAFTTVIVICLAPVWFSAPNYFFNDTAQAMCQHTTDAAVDSASNELLDIHGMLVVSLAIIWAALVAGSLVFAWYQRRHFDFLDEETSLMADFAFKAKGFPADATEEEIRQWAVFGAGRDELVGVSIAYDYSHRVDWVNKMVDFELERQELNWWRLNDASDLANITPDDNPETNTEQIKWILKSLKGSGKVFLVFASETARINFQKAFIAKKKPNFREYHPIELKAVVSEPVSTFWDAFGTDWGEFTRKCFKEGGIVLLACFLLSFFGYLPATVYLMYYSDRTGDDQEFDLTTSLLGILLASLNGILSFAINHAVHRVGLSHKWIVDSANMVGCVIVVGLNTFFNLAISHTAAASSHRLLLLSDGKGQVLRDYAWRRVLADTLWNLFMPGLLVVPFVFRAIFWYILSGKAYMFYFVSLPFGRMPFSMRDLRSNPEVELRDVEKRLEPQPIQIEHDYANIVIVHSWALIFLFFETSHIVRSVSVLFFWVILTYGAQVYCHLRCSKLVEYTSPYLADTFNYVLAIPISMVAAASVHWAVLSGTVPEGFPPVAFAFALITHWLLLTLTLVHSPLVDRKAGQTTFEDTRKQLRYDYFNTNPVHVLKQNYLEGRNIVPFRRGKEHLQRGMPMPKDNDTIKSGWYSKKFIC